ncbi:13654_t:CDS:2 [Entrophospora sp. SA101]|nr:13654_t:CDS:2 [Entrophospora sp. SA101]
MFFASKIIRSKFPRRLFIFYLLFSLIPIATEGVEGQTIKDKISVFPEYSPENGLKCDAVDFHEHKIFGTFGCQLGKFIPIAFLLFTVAVYGTKSVFGYMKTCLIDDVTILTSSLVPIFSWYIFGKPLWYKVLGNFTEEYHEIHVAVNDYTRKNNTTRDDSKVSGFNFKIDEINKHYKFRVVEITIVLLTSFSVVVCLMLYIGSAFYKRRSKPNDKFFVTVYTCVEINYFLKQYDDELRDFGSTNEVQQDRKATFLFNLSDYGDDTIKSRNMKNLKRYKVNSVDGYVYVREDPKETEEHEETEEGVAEHPKVDYFYVIIDDESVYLHKLEITKDDNIDGWNWKLFFCFWKDKKEERIKKQIKEGIKSFINDHCRVPENRKIEKDYNEVNNGMTKPEEIMAFDDEKSEKAVNSGENIIEKTKTWKIEGYVLVNVLQTGFLNYLVYSHRTSKLNNINPIGDKLA